ncbi:MAG: hypothetical protein HQL54_13365 [Magnetococcales bacterium]|nr:hypothetical protein [Magnetococcales bacterium]
MRMLTTEEAFVYVGCRSVNQFRSEVKQGVWPEPLAKHSRPQRWSREQLDATISGRPPAQLDEVALIDRALGIV